MGTRTDRADAGRGSGSSPLVASTSWHQRLHARTERQVLRIAGLDPQAVAFLNSSTVDNKQAG